ncbi:MAG: hypothetical protein K2X64_00520 [Rhodocyclaceae bacterium]|nr:hypothetical protein [Rhodocyclaceae bacterium]
MAQHAACQDAEVQSQWTALSANKGWTEDDKQAALKAIVRRYANARTSTQLNRSGLSVRVRQTKSLRNRLKPKTARKLAQFFLQNANKNAS